VLNYIKIKFNIVKFRKKPTAKTLKKETTFDTSKGMNNYYMFKFQHVKGSSEHMYNKYPNEPLK